MAKFVFQLEGVLRQRTHAEQQKQRELAQVRARLAAMEAELRAMDEQRNAAAIDLRDNRLVGKLDLAFLAAHRRYTLAMDRKAIEHARQMAAVRKEADEAQRALAEAAKQRKVIEKLREKQLERWRSDQSRKELAELDEVAMQLSVRGLFEPSAADSGGGGGEAS